MTTALKAFWGVCALIVVAAVTWVLAVYVFGTAQSETADFRGGVSQREQTNGSGQYRIAQYDFYFTTCNRVIADEQNIDDMSQPQPGLPASVAATNLQAAVQGRRDDVASYNSRAQAGGTSGQFRDSGLPYQLPTVYVPNGAKTTCAA